MPMPTTTTTMVIVMAMMMMMMMTIVNADNLKPAGCLPKRSSRRCQSARYSRLSA